MLVTPMAFVCSSAKSLTGWITEAYNREHLQEKVNAHARPLPRSQETFNLIALSVSQIPAVDPLQ